MSEEAAFLRAIQANPTDTTAKLVYADWLDEHGESERAEYLRLSVRLQAKRTPDSELRRMYELQIRNRVWVDLTHSGVPAWDDVTQFALGRLCGLLETYATLNGHRSDISYAFDADLVPRAGTIEEMTARQFGGASAVELEPMTNWEDGLSGVLEDWLFRELRALRNVAHTQLAFLTDDGRRGSVAHAIAHVRAVITPVAGWRLQSTGGPRRGIVWADLALEAADRVLFLHFDFDD